ncbi:hypothetical protein Taro_033487 [Colocasia esculenta]|uniref:Uncharacterized protein n=1 Tax=Colocasia esculenta TaxID=4460 RepID=A0A843W953_COLES|nr:hypothetical protein [Colocasia esculenta]
MGTFAESHREAAPGCIGAAVAPVAEGFNNELGSFGGRIELLRRRRKVGNPEFHPLHPLLHSERRLGTSVDTTWASVDTLSQNSPEGVLRRPLVSTLLWLVSTHCPSLAKSTVSTLPELVSTLPDQFCMILSGSDEEPVESDGTEKE